MNEVEREVQSPKIIQHHTLVSMSLNSAWTYDSNAVLKARLGHLFPIVGHLWNVLVA